MNMFQILRNRKIAIAIALIIIIPAYNRLSAFDIDIKEISKNINYKILIPSIDIDLKNKLKKYLIPYRQIDILEKDLNRYLVAGDRIIPLVFDNDIKIRNSQVNLRFELSDKRKYFSKSNLIYKRFKPTGKDILLRGINKPVPASSYLETYDDKLFILSSVGVLGYSNYTEKKEINFTQIKTNIGSYLDNERVRVNNKLSIKDLLIDKNKAYISYTREVKNNCWNISVVYSNLNYKEMNFMPLFMPSECVDKSKLNEFNAHQSGGRIIKLNTENIIISTGDFRNRSLSQDEKSVLGKLIKINIKNKNYSIISKGHRNIQGLYYNKMKNYIVATEHGPKGGDEINIIDLNIDNIPNFGWPISSYGEHYSYDAEKYKKYPLYKSHKDYGFIEPIKYFIPSIGISEIAMIKNNGKYIVSSLIDSSLYFINIGNDNKIKSFNRIYIGERIRDITLLNNTLFLYLEDSGSIGVINIK